MTSEAAVAPASDLHPKKGIVHDMPAQENHDFASFVIWAFEALAQDLTADTDHVVDKEAAGSVPVELVFTESEASEQAFSDAESAGNETINWLDVTYDVALLTDQSVFNKTLLMDIIGSKVEEALDTWEELGVVRRCGDTDDFGWNK